MKNSFLITLLAAGALNCTIVNAATTLTGTGLYGSKTLLPSTFGSNVTGDVTGIATSTDASGIVGTPDITLLWTPGDGTGGSSGGSSAGWCYHPWSGGLGKSSNVFQMSGCSTSAIFSILFTPTSDTGVFLGGFNFIGDTANDQYQFNVSIVDVNTNASVWTQTTNAWTTQDVSPYNNGPQISMNYTGDIGVAYRLDIQAVTCAYSARNNIAIDNISFAQIPEPSTYGLIAGGLLVLGAGIVRRRRSK